MTPAQFAALARARRTSMVVDRDRPVPHQLVAELCELAQWAPNHKRTWPWRFALCEGEGR
ncbi:MAG TPA: nitroreductase, partial [Acidimicrobiaceae bacterium]|nr:nitroreductase [Acidimicrobiaceae bacterium]